MKAFDRGVSYYTKGQAVIHINFPENDVCCRWCPFCRSEGDLKRYWCRLTNAMLYNPEYPQLPEECPIKFKEE